MSSGLEEQTAAELAASAEAKRARNARLLVYVILFAVACLPYANTLFNSFVYDDVPQIMENPYVRSWRYVPEIFGTNVWSFQGQSGQTNYYRPLMTFSYLVLYQIFELVPFGFHLTNVLLNAAVVLLLYALTGQLFRDRWVAIAAAVIFALHPIHSEVVAWVAALPDLQLTIFFLLTMLLYTREGEFGWKRHAGIVVSFTLALFSKEPAMMLPPLAMVYEHFLRPGREGIGWQRKVARYAPLWGLAVGYVGLRAMLLGGLAPVSHRAHFTWGEAILSAPALVWQYFTKIFWPVNLLAFHPFYKSTSWLEPKVLGGLAVMVVCAAAFFVLWKRQRLAAFALLWFFLTLGPVLNVRWMTASVLNERYLYLPSVGFCWIAALVAQRVWRRAKVRGTAWRRAAAGAAAVVAVLAVVRITTRNEDWQTDMKLYTHTVTVAPDAHLIRISLGTALWMRGDTRGAEREWRRVYERAPDNPILLLNLGVAESKKKNYKEAIGFFEKAIESRPEFWPTRLQLAETYLEIGDLEKAEASCQKGVELTPLNVSLLNCLGRVYLKTGRVEEAKALMERSIKIQINPNGYRLLGECHARLGDKERARMAFEQAVELNPYDHDAHFQLGELYAEMGRVEDAIQQYEKGLLTNPNDAKAKAALTELRRKLIESTAGKR